MHRHLSQLVAIFVESGSCGICKAGLLRIAGIVAPELLHVYSTDGRVLSENSVDLAEIGLEYGYIVLKTTESTILVYVRTGVSELRFRYETL